MLSKVVVIYDCDISMCEEGDLLLATAVRRSCSRTRDFKSDRPSEQIVLVGELDILRIVYLGCATALVHEPDFCVV